MLNNPLMALYVASTTQISKGSELVKGEVFVTWYDCEHVPYISPLHNTIFQDLPSAILLSSSRLSKSSFPTLQA